MLFSSCFNDDWILHWELLLVCGKLTSTKELLKQCNYLSVRQMVYYFSVATVHKTLKQQAPVYLYEVLSKALNSGVKHRYPTRSAGKRLVAEASLEVANKSFRWWSSRQYAGLPEEIKGEQNTQHFLSKLRGRTIEQIVVWVESLQSDIVQLLYYITLYVSLLCIMYFLCIM